MRTSYPSKPSYRRTHYCLCDTYVLHSNKIQGRRWQFRLGSGQPRRVLCMRRLQAAAGPRQPVELLPTTLPDPTQPLLTLPANAPHNPHAQGHLPFAAGFQVPGVWTVGLSRSHKPLCAGRVLTVLTSMTKGSERF
eukprot:364013-Chlamydomonas_euryale.AAC.16